MKYTFFDVETANFKQSSICSIGYIVLENNKIVNKEYHLVKPEPYYMDWHNTQIHGITEDMVRNAPTFDIVWDKIKDNFNDTTLLAHFSTFDMKCLRDVLTTYDLAFPNAEYSCTCALSRRGVKGLYNYKLNTLAQYYGIEFKHHDAMEDTEACYQVLMNVLKDNHTDSIEELHQLLKIKKGYIKSNGEWESFKSMSLNSKY